MNLQLLLVPYDSGRRGWRCGAGPEHLVRAGLPAHLQRQGHIVTGIHIIEDDPAYPPAEIRTAFELARRSATTVRSARTAGPFPLVLSRQLQHGNGHFERPYARSPCHLLVRRPRRLQYARDNYVGLPGWHGPRHDNGSVLASPG